MPEPSEPVYVVRGLSKSYGAKEVLRGLDFEVERGECLVILGGSGSGKSVSLRQLNGLERPDAGSVVFDGVDLCTLSEKELFPLRRRIGMLFQGGALFDSMNVFENVSYPLREHAAIAPEAARERVADLLAMVRLPGIEEKMPADLSGGMKKRVALARSLALEPEVILFDEPTTGLDPRTSATIGSLIRRTQERLGVTAVVVTHDLALARRVGDRLAFLHEGGFRFIGTWEEADRDPDPELSGFLAGLEEELDAA